jgi:hypothetical protein
MALIFSLLSGVTTTLLLLCCVVAATLLSKARTACSTAELQLLMETDIGLLPVLLIFESKL